jgi:hypothetical protein
VWCKVAQLNVATCICAPTRAWELQRNAMTLTRMHATGTCLAATMPSLTAPDQVSQTTTNLPYVGGRLDGCEMLLNLS